MSIVHRDLKVGTSSCNCTHRALCS